MSDFASQTDWLRMVFERALDGMALVDAETQQFLHANPALCRLLGYDLSQICKLRIPDIHPQESWPYVMKAFQDQVDGKLAIARDIPYLSKNGSVSYGDVSASPISVGGRPCLMGIVRDVTDRRRVEEALRVSEERYRAATELLSDYVFRIRIEPDGRALIHSVSDNFERITGRRLEDVAQPGEWLKTIHPEDQPRIGLVLQNLFRHGTPIRSEFRTTVVRDGKELQRWVEVLGKAEWDASGRVVAIVGAVRDLTERKRAELALQESETRFRKIIEQSPMSMALVAMDGKIEYINKKAIETFGYAPADIPNMDRWWAQAYPDEAYRNEVISTWMGLVHAAIAGNHEIPGREYRVTCKDGTVKQTFIFGVPIQGKVFVMFDDVTERRQMEERLRQTEKMTAIGQLAGGIAHDFNNLLAVILGSVELLEMQLGDHPARTHASDVRTAATRASQLTRQLLAFSRRQVMQPRVLNINDVIREMEPMLHRLLGERIETRLDLEPDVHEIRVDRGQIEQVILNLAINARDAMPAGGVLAIGTRNGTLDGSAANGNEHLVVSIRDSGRGMDAETKRHLFEPFFTTKGVGEGTGLGLAMVHGIIEQSHGRITVESQLGTGTVFNIYLPKASHREPNGKAAHSEDADAHGNETVLVAEDNELTLRVTSATLRTFGYSVLEAQTPMIALRLAETHAGAIHLLLTDVVMPVMNGKELAAKVLALRPSITVMYFSAYPKDFVVKQGVLDENIEFIEKPFTAAGLARRVRAVLSTHTRK
ncbi:MAG TPA: PAS domain S-box protein [Planctomycetota bacterium]|jgi:PAS domain S-box-containing protein